MGSTAESESEQLLMLEGRGPFAESYARRGFEFNSPGVSTARHLDRTGVLETRPLLAGKDVRAEIEKLLAQRKPYYARAHVTVDTTGLAPSQVAKQIQEALEQS